MHSLARRIAWLFPMILVGACSPAKPPKAVQSTGARAPTLQISESLSWPYRLDDLQVKVDGVPAASLVPIAASGIAPENLPIQAGSHTLSLEATASVEGTECRIILKTSRTFAAAAGANPTIRIDLTTGSIASAFESRMSAAFSLTEATLEDDGSNRQTEAVSTAVPLPEARRACREVPELYEPERPENIPRNPGYFNYRNLIH